MKPARYSPAFLAEEHATLARFRAALEGMRRDRLAAVARGASAELLAEMRLGEESFSRALDAKARLLAQMADDGPEGAA